MLYKTILCATDGKEHSERALRRAITIARETGAELHVVNVEETALPPMRVGREYLAAERAETRRRVQGQITAALAGQRLTINPHYLVNPSRSVAAQIARLAERIDADLIVVGSHGRGVLTGALAGSVPQRLPHETPRPVLVLAGEGPGARRPSRLRMRQALHV